MLLPRGWGALARGRARRGPLRREARHEPVARRRCGDRPGHGKRRCVPGPAGARGAGRDRHRREQPDDQQARRGPPPSGAAGPDDGHQAGRRAGRRLPDGRAARSAGRAPWMAGRALLERGDPGAGHPRGDARHPRRRRTSGRHPRPVDRRRAWRRRAPSGGRALARRVRLPHGQRRRSRECLPAPVPRRDGGRVRGRGGRGRRPDRVHRHHLARGCGAGAASGCTASRAR